MTADSNMTMESGIRLNAMFAEKEAQLKAALDQICRLKGDCAVLTARNEALTKLLTLRDKEISDLTTPKPHDEMKMGAARKRDTRSSGKGSTGKLAGTR